MWVIKKKEKGKNTRPQNKKQLRATIVDRQAINKLRSLYTKDAALTANKFVFAAHTFPNPP